MACFHTPARVSPSVKPTMPHVPIVGSGSCWTTKALFPPWVPTLTEMPGPAPETNWQTSSWPSGDCPTTIMRDS